MTMATSPFKEAFNEVIKMRMKVAKNGKGYRCDECRELLKESDIRWLRLSEYETYHFCTWAHRQAYINMRYNLSLFPATNEQTTGNVIPVKNGANSQ